MGQTLRQTVRSFAEPGTGNRTSKVCIIYVMHAPEVQSAMNPDQIQTDRKIPGSAYAWIKMRIRSLDVSQGAVLHLKRL